MIIDMILDRKDGQKYNAKNFYNAIMDQYQSMPNIAGPIASALDGGSNEDVQNVLCAYVINNGYAWPEICKFIKSVDWINN